MPVPDSKAAAARPGTFTFTADAAGRPLAAEGWLVPLAAARDASAQHGVSGNMPGYHAGHLIPARFGGPGSAVNLVPMPDVMNTSYVKAVENAIARHLRFGPVFLRVTVDYRGAGPVPTTVHHELFTRGGAGALVAIPGGHVSTSVDIRPIAPMGRAIDPYTGRLVAPKEFLDPNSKVARGSGLAH